MSNFKGTKWEVKHSESKDAWNVVGTEIGAKYKIARCPYLVSRYLPELWNNNAKQEAKANAQLIACAPEMLEMLEELSDTMKSFDGWREEYNKLNALIKKATTI